VIGRVFRAGCLPLETVLEAAPAYAVAIARVYAWPVTSQVGQKGQPQPAALAPVVSAPHGFSRLSREG
jgi:hypothetical protein